MIWCESMQSGGTRHIHCSDLQTARGRLRSNDTMDLCHISTICRLDIVQQLISKCTLQFFSSKFSTDEHSIVVCVLEFAKLHQIPIEKWTNLHWFIAVWVSGVCKTEQEAKRNKTQQKYKTHHHGPWSLVLLMFCKFLDQKKDISALVQEFTKH